MEERGKYIFFSAATLICYLCCEYKVTMVWRAWRGEMDEQHIYRDTRYTEEAKPQRQQPVERKPLSLTTEIESITFLASARAECNILVLW